jgi:hypothetical protein
MPAVVACPSCGRKLKVPDELMGKEVRCADCAGTFLAEKPSQSSALVPARSRDLDDDYDDEQPRRRSRQRPARTIGDFEPDKSNVILACGIISLVLVLVTLVAAIIFPLAGIPFTLIGLVLGILGWRLGSTELKRIAAGDVDPAVRGASQAGWICGIVGTILHGLSVLCGCVIGIIVLAFGAAVLGLAGMAASKVPVTQKSPPPKRPAVPKKQVQFSRPLRAVDYLPLRFQ